MPKQPPKPLKGQQSITNFFRGKNNGENKENGNAEDNHNPHATQPLKRPAAAPLASAKRQKISSPKQYLRSIEIALTKTRSNVIREVISTKDITVLPASLRTKLKNYMENTEEAPDSFGPLIDLAMQLGTVMQEAINVFLNKFYDENASGPAAAAMPRNPRIRFKSESDMSSGYTSPQLHENSGAAAADDEDTEDEFTEEEVTATDLEDWMNTNPDEEQAASAIAQPAGHTTTPVVVLDDWLTDQQLENWLAANPSWNEDGIAQPAPAAAISPVEPGEAIAPVEHASDIGAVDGAQICSGCVEIEGVAYHYLLCPECPNSSAS